MRAWFLIALTGCSVDIASGAYLCGPEQLCPEDLVCNGTDNRCVLPTVREDFRCALGNPPEDPSADDQASTGQMLPALDCVSPAFERENCLDLGDAIDWYQLDTPAECNAVAIEARVEYPIAFQPVGIRFSDDGGMGTPMETECEDLSSVAAGNVVSCLEVTVQPGQRYAIGLERTGIDCDGGCPYNRYFFNVRLKTP